MRHAAVARVRRLALGVALVVGFGTLGACKGDKNKCEQACRNYAKLAYWKKADAEIAALPEAERENEKKRRLAQYSTQLETGVDLCVNQCVSANNDEMTDCMIEAKTAETVIACAADDD